MRSRDCERPPTPGLFVSAGLIEAAPPAHRGQRPKLQDTQFGFRKEKGTAQALQCTRRALEYGEITNNKNIVWFHCASHGEYEQVNQLISEYKNNFPKDKILLTFFSPSGFNNVKKNNGEFIADGKELLNDYISQEELWACTSCNACVEACPIGIDPLSIIMDMRQYLVMEKSSAPGDLNNMMGNIENNGAPWPFNNQDRLLWANEN